jgi:carbon storage regulator CsrA
MLVLSRRQNEQIVFPGFSTVIKVLGVRGGKVSLGIDAPREVTVLREELSTIVPKNFADHPDKDRARQLNHLLRNRLNVAGLGLALLTRQLEVGNIQDGQATLAKIQEDFLLLNDRLETEMDQRPPAGKPVKTPKALVVEDDENERELLAGLLRLSGVQVDLAGDGADALDYLQSHSLPDVMLLDMVLPRCDGPATVRAIRKNPANNLLKIIGVTGHAPESFHLDGVDRWFRKPINPEALLKNLGQELGSRV